MKNVQSSSCRALLILVGFKLILNFRNNFSKNIQISNCMKIRPVGAELYHADRRTDGQEDRHDEANSGFSQFCERAPKRTNAHLQIFNFPQAHFAEACLLHPHYILLNTLLSDTVSVLPFE
jgi:hypothetical protein